MHWDTVISIYVKKAVEFSTWPFASRTYHSEVPPHILEIEISNTISLVQIFDASKIVKEEM